MLQAILNKFCRQHPTKQQLYDHIPPITKTIQVRRTRYTRHCWRSRDELISDVLLWTPSHGWAKAGRPARTYIHIGADTGCRLEDLTEAMDDRERWRERGEGQRRPCWWCDMMMIHIYIYIYIIIIMSCRQHGYPWPLSPLLPIVHRFWQVLGATSRILTELLVALLLLGHVRGSIGEHHLWARKRYRHATNKGMDSYQ